MVSVGVAVLVVRESVVRWVIGFACVVALDLRPVRTSETPRTKGNASPPTHPY